MKARFRCDNCGHHVPLKHNECPNCGKLFSSVVCPKCHFEGESHLFTDGCPDCGYEGHEGKSGIRNRSADPLARPRKGLPSWVYLWTSLGLLAVLVILVLLMFQR